MRHRHRPIAVFGDCVSPDWPTYAPHHCPPNQQAPSVKVIHWWLSVTPKSRIREQVRRKIYCFYQRKRQFVCLPFVRLISNCQSALIHRPIPVRNRYAGVRPPSCNESLHAFRSNLHRCHHWRQLATDLRLCVLNAQYCSSGSESLLVIIYDDLQSSTSIERIEC